MPEIGSILTVVSRARKASPANRYEMFTAVGDAGRSARSARAVRMRRAAIVTRPRHDVRKDGHRLRVAPRGGAPFRLASCSHEPAPKGGVKCRIKVRRAEAKAARRRTSSSAARVAVAVGPAVVGLRAAVAAASRSRRAGPSAVPASAAGRRVEDWTQSSARLTVHLRYPAQRRSGSPGATISLTRRCASASASIAS